MNRPVRAILFAIILMAWTLTVAGGCEKWSYVRPLPTGDDLMSVAFDGTQFWVVGDHGLVMTSPDGLQWETHDVSTDKKLYDVSFSGDQVVMVGAWDQVCVFNGQSWFAHTIGPPNHALRSVTHALGLFVCVGDSGAIKVSEDGLGWTSYASGTSKDLQDVIFDGSRFIAVGSDSTLCWSVDGANWTLADPVGSSDLAAVHAFNGWIYTCSTTGTIYRSQDLQTWTQIALPLFRSRDFFQLNGTLFVAGSKVFSSSTGLAWTEQHDFDVTAQSCVQGDGLLLAVGDVGFISRSFDGQQWQQTSQGTTEYHLAGVAGGPENLVVVGQHGSVLTSDDGLNWQIQESHVTQDLVDVAWCMDEFIAVGWEGCIIGSPDGETWTTQANIPGCLTAITSNEALSISVAVGVLGLVMYRQHGGTWTQATSPLPNSSFYDVMITQVTPTIWRFIAVGSSGRIIVSSDGIHWTESSSSGLTANSLSLVKRLGGKYVMMDWASIYISDWGTTWVQHTLSDSIDTSLFDCVFHDGRFMVLAGNLDSGGLLFSSSNGVEWDMQSLHLTARPLEAIIFGDVAMAVGTSGSILIRETFSRDWSLWPLTDLLTLTDEINAFCAR